MIEQYIIPSVITLLGVIFTGYTGWKLGRIKDATERKNINSNAEAEFRDDLLSAAKDQRDELLRKDAIIEALRIRNNELEKINNELKTDNKILNYIIKNLEDKIIQQSRKVDK